MDRKGKVLFSNFKSENWVNLILFAIFCFYVVYFSAAFNYGHFGVDYMAYWSVGKIADVKGYSEIYDLNNLRSVQTQELNDSSLQAEPGNSSVPLFPVPYFSFFLLPFQLLSRLSLFNSFWIWTILNLVILVGYLVFFIRRTNPGSRVNRESLYFLALLLISYPVFFNLTCGQVEVFLLVCTGEFIRYAISKKPIYSGIWLGGLLLKPQLLILIIPIILIMRNWRVLMGFIISSGIILITSTLLSGFAGMKALVNLWTKFSADLTTSYPEAMINWRMIGVNLNDLFNTSLGWLITGLGLILTLIAVYFLIKHKPPYGSPQWVMIMLGVFSATLAITWHSHYHMAMILIPFLIYALLNKLLLEKIITLWAIVTPVAWLVILIIEILFLDMTNINISNINGIIIGFLGFIFNLVILISTLQFIYNSNSTHKCNFETVNRGKLK